MASKRIFIFSTAYLPFIGGAEIAIKEITDRISDTHFELITAKLRSDLPNQEQIGKVLVHRIGFGIPLLDKIMLPFWGSIKLYQLEREKPVDLYWSVMASYAGWIPYVLNMFRFSSHVPIVLTLQEGDPLEHISKARFGLINLSWHIMLARTDFLTTISTYLKNIALFMGYKGISEVIPNGVDLSVFGRSIPELERAALRKELGITEHTLVLITTSRLVKKNGVADIIRALTMLPSDTALLILGSGEEETMLKALAKEQGVDARVKFLGLVEHQMMPRYLSIAHVFVRPSLSEGMGNSFIEAMAAGVPVVATKIGGIPDFLFDGETGLFCEVQNPKSIALHVSRLFDDASLRTKIIENAKKLVSSVYTWELVSKRMDAVFDNIRKPR